MAGDKTGLTQQIGQRTRSALGRVEVLALFPLIVLLADWFGFDNLAMVTAVALSALLAIAVLLPRRTATAQNATTSLTGKDSLFNALEAISDTEGRDTICLLIEIDDWPDVVGTWGFDTAQELAKRTHDRLQTTLRRGDVLCKMGDARFGIVLAAMPAARLGIRDTIANRLAEVVREPLHISGATVHLSAGIGHSSLRERAIHPADATIKAAEAALTTALAKGPGTIQAYSDGMGRACNAASDLGTEVEDAIHSGDIDAWFMPQVCAKTGSLTGMEVVPRWQHPKHGLLGPSEMQPALKASGHRHLFGQVMIHRTLEALPDLDMAQVQVPTISLALSLDILTDPLLAETISSDIRRHNLTPDRIAFEITQDVAAERVDPEVLDTLAALEKHGHRIDLASASATAVPLLALQDFRVGRVKIDHALTLDIDTNPQKAQAVGAIVAMAGAMDMQTLATGVGTSAEQDHLAGLGCDHVQGFGIGRPMRAAQIPDWVRAQRPTDRPPSMPERRVS